MNLHRLFLIALLTTTFAVLGCGDSGGGGGNGNGGADAACDGPLCQASEASRSLCVTTYNECISEGGSAAACAESVEFICAEA